MRAGLPSILGALDELVGVVLSHIRRKYIKNQSLLFPQNLSISLCLSCHLSFALQYDWSHQHPYCHNIHQQKHYKTVSQSWSLNFKDEYIQTVTQVFVLTVYANRKPLVDNSYPSTRPSHVNRPPKRKK